jgi:predicted ATP-binding protein involved in virulence
VINSNYSTIKKLWERNEKAVKKALENNYQYNYDIYDKSLSIRLSNYDGTLSPYKSKIFKKLNKMVSKKTNIAIYSDNTMIEDIWFWFSRSILW